LPRICLSCPRCKTPTGKQRQFCADTMKEALAKLRKHLWRKHRDWMIRRIREGKKKKVVTPSLTGGAMSYGWKFPEGAEHILPISASKDTVTAEEAPRLVGAIGKAAVAIASAVAAVSARNPVGVAAALSSAVPHIMEAKKILES